MTDIKAVLFDLDGTLLDTLSDLATSMNSVLARFDFPTHPREAYRYFVGDGVEALARRVLPEERRTPATVRRCVEAMRAEYQEHWADTTKLYQGIPELLDALAGRGLRLNILSNKPDDFTRLTVDHFLPRWPWSQVRGVSPETPPKPDPRGALAIAEQLGLEPRQFLYLGDTNTDIKTALACGMYPVGALWGFRTATELTEAGAKALLENPEQLLEMIG
jgi:phosphoglycolate phosphatase